MVNGKFPNFQTSQFPNFPTSQFPNSATSQFPNFPISQFRNSAIPQFFIFNFQFSILYSAIPQFRNSAIFHFQFSIFNSQFSISMRICIVEDDGPLLENLRLLLDGEPSMNVTGAYRSAEDALKGTIWKKVDILLVDIGLAEMSGIDLIRRLSRFTPTCASSFIRYTTTARSFSTRSRPAPAGIC